MPPKADRTHHKLAKSEDLPMTKSYDGRDRGNEDDRYPPISEVEADAGARAIVKLFDLWELDDAEACALLGGISIKRWERWKQGRAGRIDRECAIRLSLLLGVHVGSKAMFSNPALVRAWIRASRPDLGGEAPLSVMMSRSVTGLERVRHLLFSLGQ